MQKLLDFLEQHVQWIALGLGGLFLTYMVFSYVVQSPLKVSAGGRELTAGDIDTATLEGPVTALKNEIARTTVPSIPQKEYVGQFVATIAGENQQVAMLSPTQIRSVPMSAAGPLGISSPDGAIAGGPDGAEKPIAQLPKPPAARPGPSTGGRSTVTFQDPAWQFNPARPNQLPPMVTEDRDWWSGSFTISAEALAKAFTDAIDEKKLDLAGLPDPSVFFQTAILDVELVRQEILPGNKAGKETIVPPLKHSLRPPFPGKDAKDFEIATYIEWATGSQPGSGPAEVLTPPFYQVVSGDDWVAPGEQTEQLAAMTTEQRREQRKLRQQQRQQELQQRNMMAQQRRGMVGGRPGGFMGMEGEMEMGMMDGEGGYVPPMVGRGGYPPRGVPGMGGVPGVGMRPRFGAGAYQPQQIQPAQPIGPGRNDVRNLADIQIIAHDDTIQPGKTYRYKVRYKILNPVYRTNAAKPELTAQLAIDAPASPWTEPVRTRSKVEFFLASASLQKATFDVFQWDKGRMIKKSLSVAPGDAVGETGYNVVDVRTFGRKSYVLITDETGIVARREPEGNGKESDRYLFLLDEYEITNPTVGMRN